MLYSVETAILTLAVVLAVVPVQTRVLKHLDLVQPIRKELPADQQKKRGTPLMGGLVFLLGAVITVSFHPSPLSYFFAITFVMFSSIGFLDDFRKAHQKNPNGISGKTKLVLQFLFTGVLLYYLYTRSFIDASLVVHRDLTLQLLPALFIFMVSLFIVGSTNAINFTDGLDGLLSVVAIPTYFFFFMISERTDVRVFCLIMIACLLGFLFYNSYPASLIMGDTGSMAIGGSLSFLAVLEKVEILVPLLFIIYFAEILSVIIQVSYFKRTGKRLFRMSPIHYHFSLKYGWKENQIVLVFGLVSWTAAILCYGYYRLFMA